MLEESSSTFSVEGGSWECPVDSDEGVVTCIAVSGSSIVTFPKSVKDCFPGCPSLNS